MRFKDRFSPVFVIVVIVSLAFAGVVLAQGHPELITLSIGSGSDSAEVEAAEALIERMTRDGQLMLMAAHGDNQRPGRRHEGFSQYYSGIPVHGASLSKQTESGTTVSIFGTIFTDIDVSLNSFLSLGDAVTVIEESFGATALHETQALRSP